MEEIGRAVAPVPFLSSAVLATVALLGAGDTETVSELASGEVTAALVVPLSTAPGAPITGVEIGADGLTGLVSTVAGATEADLLVVPVAGPDGPELHTVARSAAGVDVSPVLALDMTRPLADVRFSGAASALVGPGSAALERGPGNRGGRARVRATRVGAVVFRHHAGLREGAQAVRPPHRLLPGDQTPARRRLVRGQCRDSGGALRRRHLRPARCGRGRGGRTRAGLLQRRRRASRRGMRADCTGASG